MATKRAKATKQAKQSGRKTTPARARTSRATNPAAPAPRIGDAAVQARTGRAWAEWVAVLDKAGARGLPHRDIARLLHERFGIDRWWNQMVAVGYEQLAGLRVVLQNEGGFSATASLTVPTDITKLFDAAMAGSAWLPRGVVVHKSTRPKSLRATTPGGRKSISVNFYAKVPGKAQVTADQVGLATQAEALDLKQQWAASLRALAAACQSPRAETRTALQGRKRTPTRRK